MTFSCLHDLFTHHPANLNNAIYIHKKFNNTVNGELILSNHQIFVENQCVRFAEMINI